MRDDQRTDITTRLLHFLTMSNKLLIPKIYLAVFFSTLFQFYIPSTLLRHSLPATQQNDYPFRTTFRQTGQNNPSAELEWRLDAAANTVEFRLKTRVIHAEGTVSEWIAFGMSGNGSLVEADLIVFWLNRNRIQFTDSWTDNSRIIHKDMRQNFKVLQSAAVPENHLQLVFSRRIETCDDRDYKIENGTVNLLFLRGYHSQLDSDDFPSPLNQTTFATRRVQIMKSSNTVPEIPRDVRITEILVDKVKIPAQTTTYWCEVHKFPPAPFKHHIIRYEAVISPGSEDLVHHIEVYNCGSQKGKSDPSYRGSCYGEEKPNSLASCKHVIAAWAMGAEPFIYPEEVGLAIGGSKTSIYLMIEIHYNNPAKTNGRMDSSGIRFYDTPALRLNDAGFLEVGVVYSPNQSIPPNMPNFVLTGYCTSQCTRKGLPQSGINVFASQLHTHLTGTAVWTEHFRNGIELDEINRDNHYSAQFQEIRVLPKPIHIRPGDTLVTHCRYDTRSRTNITLGGLEIESEMCVNYIHYYPRGSLEVCKSTVSENTIHAFLKHMGGDLENLSVAEGLRSVAWNGRTKQLWHDVIQNAPIDIECLQTSGGPVFGEWIDQMLPVTLMPRLKRKRHCTSNDWRHLFSNLGKKTYHI